MQLPDELNPHPELFDIWARYQEKTNLDNVIATMTENRYHLPPVACRKRLEIAQTIKTQRLIHGI